MSGRAKVTAAEIIRNFGHWQRQALVEPLTITHHGRSRTMLISVEEYEALTAACQDQMDRRAESEAHTGLAVVLENTAEGFIACDARLYLRDMNAVAGAFFGLSRIDAIGRPLPELLRGKGDEFIIEGMRRVLRSAEIVSVDVGAVPPSGRQIRLRLFPYFGGAAMLFANITEQERWRESAEDWRSCSEALDCNPATCWMKLDARGHIVEAPAGAARLTGFSQDTLEAISLFDLVRPADRPVLQQAFQSLLQGRQATELALHIVGKNGCEQAVRLSLSPLVRNLATQGVLAIACTAPPQARAVQAA